MGQQGGHHGDRRGPGERGHGIPQTVPLHVAMDMNTSEVLVVEKLAEKIVPGRGLVSIGLHATQDGNKHITFQVMGKDSDIRELNAVVLSMDFAGRDARGRHEFCRRGSACSRSSP